MEDLDDEEYRRNAARRERIRERREAARRMEEEENAKENDDMEDTKEDDSVNKPKQPQLSEGQAKALLSELSPKLREELCHVLRSMSEDTPEDKRPRMSPELSRIMTRFSRRAGLLPGQQRLTDPGDETWPMYLGIFLFIAIVILFVYIWLQESIGADEEAMIEEQDDYWILREF
mmetsp:Transcript_2566/g.5266  ORF Transcript_2566/g.5266 Transcript_2566/m.5266 type:complete len:175 (-) Transcript_2566:64-588(-)